MTQIHVDNSRSEEPADAAHDREEMKRTEDLLRIQRDICITIGSTSDLTEAFDYLLESVCQIDGIDCGGVYRVDCSTGDLDLMVHRGLSDEFLRSVSHLGPDSPNAGIVMAGEPVYSRYSDLDLAKDEVGAREGLKGIAIIPVKHDGRVIAVINISSYSEGIPQAARTMLESIAAQVGGLLARIRTEEALRESEGHHRLLAENISDVIWTMDMEIKGLTYVSPSVRNLTGFTPGEITRMSPAEMLVPESFKKAKDISESQVDKVRSGSFEPITVDAELVCRDGGTVSIESTVSVVYAGDGTPMYILGVTRDVSERKRLEEQLRQSAKMPAEPGTTVHESARTIERAAERAVDLTRKLLSFARRGRQRNEAVDLHELVRNVITLLRQTISESVRISCEMNQDELSVTGDPGQIEQVLLNLALNARDAMPSGGELTICTEMEELGEMSHPPEPDILPGRYAVLTVTDTGSGIAPDDLERITTFRVYLPQDRQEALDEPRSECDMTAHTGCGRILIIDDEDLVRDVARSMLEVCGYDVVDVSNGRDALEYYRNHGDGIDLVLIDMVMPGMNGRECFRALREINPAVRAVLSTGYGANGEAKEIVQEGMAGLVLKPFSKGALAATVREALCENVLATR